MKYEFGKTFQEIGYRAKTVASDLYSKLLPFKEELVPRKQLRELRHRYRVASNKGIPRSERVKIAVSFCHEFIKDQKHPNLIQDTVVIGNLVNWVGPDVFGELYNLGLISKKNFHEKDLDDLVESCNRMAIEQGWNQTQLDETS